MLPTFSLSQQMLLARQETRDKKMLARRVAPLDPSYRTALFSRTEIVKLRVSSLKLEVTSSFRCQVQVWPSEPPSSLCATLP